MRNVISVISYKKQLNVEIGTVELHSPWVLIYTRLFVLRGFKFIFATNFGC
jgi:hypothetical protein